MKAIKHTIKLQLTKQQIIQAIEYATVVKRLGFKAGREHVLHSDEEHFLYELCNELYINLLLENIIDNYEDNQSGGNQYE